MDDENLDSSHFLPKEDAPPEIQKIWDAMDERNNNGEVAKAVSAAEAAGYTVEINTVISFVREENNSASTAALPHEPREFVKNGEVLPNTFTPQDEKAFPGIKIL